MFPNCYLHTTVFMWILILLSLICLVVAVAGCYVMRGTKKMPRLIAQFVILLMVWEWCQLVALGLEGRPGIATEIFAIFHSTVGGCSIPFLLLWTIVSPTLELMMLRKKLKRLAKWMEVFAALFFLEHILLYSCALVFQYNGNYATFNKVISGHFFFMSFYVVFLLFSLRKYSQRLFIQIDKIIQNLAFSSDSKIDSKRSSKDMDGETSVINNDSPNAKIIRHRKKLGR